MPDNVILLVEDNPAHAEILRRAISATNIPTRVEHAVDGQVALDFLYRRNVFGDPAKAPRPELILLDLRMPNVDGFQVLATIKADPDLRSLPVVVLSTSASWADRQRAYCLHANSYLVKPVSYRQTLELIDTLCRYWLQFNHTSGRHE